MRSVPRGLVGVAFLLTLTIVMTITHTAAAAPAPITIREQLNQTYGPELVSYPLAKLGEKSADTVQVSDANGPVAAQLGATDGSADDGRKPRSLYILVPGLKPLSAVTFNVAFNVKFVPPAPSDLHVVKQNDQVEITTAHVGARLLLGEGKPAKPVALKDAPAPLLGMRLEAGAWAGSSKFTGEGQVASWSSKVTDEGPAFVRVTSTYTFVDGNTLTLKATVVAGDSVVRWDMAVRDDHPELALNFQFPPVPGVTEAFLPQGYGQWSKSDRTFPIKTNGQPVAMLTPNTSVAMIFPEDGWSIRLAPVGNAGAALQFTSRDPGCWVDPVAPMTYGGFKTWELEMIPKSWENWKRKRLPVTYSADGSVALEANLAKGQRKWSVGAGLPRVGERLDWVKDLVLDWPAKKAHPSLIVDQKEVEAAWARAAADAEFGKALQGGDWAAPALRVLAKPAAQRTDAEKKLVVDRLRSQLAMMGNFDVMRAAIGTVSLYDAIIDSDLITPQEKSLFRAQMAYLGYLMADPQVWSIERGYHTGNPNMSCSYTLSQGVIACALSDHPMAKQWADYASSWEEKWLADDVGPNGEWIPEGSHYGYVSLEPMVVYPITAQRAGFHDFTNDERLKKVVLYFCKSQSPRDVQRKDLRCTGTWGRGTSGDREPIFGVAARMTARKDPELSKSLQWMWGENGYPVYLGDARLGGFDPYYEDRTLPTKAPEWKSDWFPNLGVFLRSAFNSPSEGYLNFLCCVDSQRNLDIWTPTIGSISQWFGRGKPLSTSWSTQVGYAERHELNRDGVRLARNWGEPGDSKLPFGYYNTTHFAGFAGLPTADYARTTIVNTHVDDRDWFPTTPPPAYPRVTPAKSGKLEWTRQLLQVKDADPAGPAWIVLRDTTKGGEPTAWQFWTLSEKVGTPEQAKDVAAFLADKPGPKLMPARELPGGSRYTAIGQYDMDVEYFIANPTNTPRFTLRYGGKDNSQIPQWQDLLMLQQPGDGYYYVALFPRPRAEAAPNLSNLADGKVIKAAGAFGTDYAFLSPEETTAAADDITFRGTSACVQVRTGGTTLSLGAAGELHWTKFAIASPVAAAMSVAGDKITISFPAENAGGLATLTVPAGWKAKDKSKGVEVDDNNGKFEIKVPAGPAQVVLVAKK